MNHSVRAYCSVRPEAKEQNSQVLAEAEQARVLSQYEAQHGEVQRRIDARYKAALDAGRCLLKSGDGLGEVVAVDSFTPLSDSILDIEKNGAGYVTSIRIIDAEPYFMGKAGLEEAA